MRWKKTVVTMGTVLCTLACPAMGSLAASEVSNIGYYNDNAELVIYKAAAFDSGYCDEEGGVAEIIKYNKDNGMFYLVNGKTGKLQMVSVAGQGGALNQGGHQVAALTLNKEIDLKASSQAMDSTFAYGDMTSVDVNTSKKLIAVALQAAGYNDNGRIAVLDYEGNLLKLAEAGKQPDMVVFTPDGSKILCANEGEPREGYQAADPEGSVTVATVSGEGSAATRSAETIGFEDFDSQRDALATSHVIIKKNTKPSVDFEPEYITVSEDGKNAFISLQEANAIAKLNLETNQYEYVRSLGFKDHNQSANALDLRKDGAIGIETQNVYGIYMPDGIAAFTVNGKTYVATANEGDGREWGDEEAGTYYCNEKEENDIVYFDASDYDGLEAGKRYVFGGRSFSIFDGDTMELVYDSGSELEQITAGLLPEIFNCSNDKVKLDNRSGKKGPEAEDIKTGVIAGKTYAFVGLERIGGVMVYDVTTPSTAKFVNYINTRDFSEDIRGDVSPEGLCFIPAEDSVTGKPQLLVANEVSGTVAVMQMERR